MENDAVKFESYGAKLRNLLGPYANLIAVIEMYKETGDVDKFNKLINILNVEHLNKNLDRLLEFSHLDELEKLNIRETNFGEDND